MEVTKELVLSQLTPDQVQKLVVADQPEGVGEREERSLDMAAESSAEETERRQMRRRCKKRWRVAICSGGFLNVACWGQCRVCRRESRGSMC